MMSSESHSDSMKVLVGCSVQFGANINVSDCVFFFKQKTAYEMLRSLVGSEMCIRDSFRLQGYLCIALAVLELTL